MSKSLIDDLSWRVTFVDPRGRRVTGRRIRRLSDGVAEGARVRPRAKGARDTRTPTCVRSCIAVRGGARQRAGRAAEGRASGRGPGARRRASRPPRGQRGATDSAPGHVRLAPCCKKHTGRGNAAARRAGARSRTLVRVRARTLLRTRLRAHLGRRRLT